MPTLRIAVLTDIHVHDPVTHPSAPSHARRTPVGQPSHDPFLSLHELIATSHIEADLLVCLGDLGHQAHPESIIDSWTKIRTVQEKLGGIPLLATTGNHDVDSYRSYTPHDPTESVRFRLEEYPVAERHLRIEYWADDSCVIERDSYRIVLLNSSSLHHTKEDARHGEVSVSAIARLNEKLGTSTKPINILACHHHPQRYGDIDQDDYQALRNSEELVAMLDNRPDSWAILHGHKHRPRVRYCAGSSSSPALFGAGSFSAMLSGEVQSAGNQFYLLTFDPDAATSLGLELACSFQSWTWRLGSGWAPQNDGMGLPPVGGFGCRRAPRELATEIAAAIGNTRTYWADLLAAVPVMRFVGPDDLLQVCKRLEIDGFLVKRDQGSNAVEYIQRDPETQVASHA